MPCAQDHTWASRDMELMTRRGRRERVCICWATRTTLISERAMLLFPGDSLMFPPNLHLNSHTEPSVLYSSSNRERKRGGEGDGSEDKMQRGEWPNCKVQVKEWKNHEERASEDRRWGSETVGLEGGSLWVEEKSRQGRKNLWAVVLWCRKSLREKAVH